jgi:hypothetical protein
MKYLLTLLFSLVMLQHLAIAQEQIKYFTKPERIDKDRYANIKGSPMLFTTWRKSNLYSVYDTTFTEEFLNYNGFNQELEVQTGDNEFVILNSKFYYRVEIEDEKAPNGKIVLKKDAHPLFKQSFVQMIYESDKIRVIKFFKARSSDMSAIEIGRAKNLISFYRTSNYFLIDTNDTLVQLKTNKKSLLNTLGFEDQLEDYITKETLDLSNDADLNRLFAYFDGLK